MPDRRQPDRRVSSNTPGEKVSRIRERRVGERRESPRAPMSFLVRNAGGEDDDWVERKGELSLGGFHWVGNLPPRGAMVEVRFRIPGFPKEIRAKGEVKRMAQEGEVRMRVRFTELDVVAELAIARFLDEHKAGAYLS